MQFEEFRKEYIENIKSEAIMNSTTSDYVFMEKMKNMIEDIGDATELLIKYFEKNNIMINGYGFNEIDKSLIIYINDYQDEIIPPALNMERIDSLWKKMYNFLDTVSKGKLHSYCDDSNEYVAISRSLYDSLNGFEKFNDNYLEIEKIKFLIFTNSKLSDRIKNLNSEYHPKEINNSIKERKIELEIWHIEKIYEIENSVKEREKIEIKISDFGHSLGIPVIKANITGTDEYEAYLGIIPGKILSNIFDKYGSKLLEGNVRSFLTNKGKVNKGIRKTIIEEPTKFFTYNNGIATTANEITIEKKEGQTLITSIKDFQIINGGQTTASLTSASRKKESKLDDIFVPMKITIVKNIDSYDEIVKNISKYANSQNKVTDADMFSNHPFHVRFERLAEKNYVRTDSMINTFWFYERSRGRYIQEKSKFLNSKVEREKFEKKFPKHQVLKKEELAKYMNALNCKPHVVNLGSTKCMNYFAKHIDALYNSDEIHSKINDSYFKKAIASAIIFRSVDKMISQAYWYKKGGYKLNIVPYTISKIIDSIPNDLRLDYNKIWLDQSVSEVFLKEANEIAQMVNEFITNSDGVIVTEYCKKEATWDKLKELKYKLSEDFINELVTKQKSNVEEKNAAREVKENKKIEILNTIYQKGDNYWKNLLYKYEDSPILTPKDLELLKLASTLNSKKIVIDEKKAKEIWNVRVKLDKNGDIV